MTKQNNNEELSKNDKEGTIEPSAAGGTTEDALLQGSKNDKEGTIEPSAAGGTAEDALLQGYRSLVEQMQAQYKELQEQNKSMQRQFSELIRSGASVGKDNTNGSSGASDNGGSPASDDPLDSATFDELGKLLGGRDYKTHNNKE